MKTATFTFLFGYMYIFYLLNRKQILIHFIDINKGITKLQNVNLYTIDRIINDIYEIFSGEFKIFHEIKLRLLISKLLCPVTSCSVLHAVS